MESTQDEVHFATYFSGVIFLKRNQYAHLHMF